MTVSIMLVPVSQSFNTILPTVTENISSPGLPAAATITPVSASPSFNTPLPIVREITQPQELPVRVNITNVYASLNLNTILPIAPGNMKSREHPAGDITTLVPFALTVQLLLKTAITVVLPSIHAASAPSARPVSRMPSVPTLIIRSRQNLLPTPHSPAVRRDVATILRNINSSLVSAVMSTPILSGAENRQL